MPSFIINKDTLLPTLKIQIKKSDGKPYALPEGSALKTARFEMIGSSSYLGTSDYDDSKIDHTRYNLRLSLDHKDPVTIDVTKEKGVRAIALVHSINDESNTVAAANASNQASAETLANELKIDFNRHIQNLDSGDNTDAYHIITDSGNLVTAPDANDEASLVTLTNDLLNRYNAHLDSPGVHVIDDIFNDFESSGASDLATAIKVLNTLKAKYENHRTQVNPSFGTYSLGEIIDNINEAIGETIAYSSANKLLLKSNKFGSDSELVIENGSGEVTHNAVLGLFGEVAGNGDLTGTKTTKGSPVSPDIDSNVKIDPDREPAVYDEAKAADTSQLGNASFNITLNIDGRKETIDITGDGGNAASYEVDNIVKRINTVYRGPVCVNCEGRLELYSLKRDSTSIIEVLKSIAIIAYVFEITVTSGTGFSDGDTLDVGDTQFTLATSPSASTDIGITGGAGALAADLTAIVSFLSTFQDPEVQLFDWTSNSTQLIATLKANKKVPDHKIPSIVLSTTNTTANPTNKTEPNRDVAWAIFGISETQLPITKTAKQNGKVEYVFRTADTSEEGNFEGVFIFERDDVTGVDSFIRVPLSESDDDNLEIKVLGI